MTAANTRVLLLHGIGGGRAIWSGTAECIERLGMQVVALDFPGYGQTPGPTDIDTLVGAVLHAADAAPSARTVLVGHSMGGMVAQELVARHPGRIHGLVLACTSASFGKPDSAWQAQFIAVRLAPLDAGEGMTGMAARLVPGLISAGLPPDVAARVRQAAADVMSRVPEATYRSALRAIAGFDRRAALCAIAVPTLCLAGEHDRTAPPDMMQRMAARIPGAEYLCLATAGHIANVEQPAAFNAAVMSFLQRHFVAAASVGAA